MPGQRADQKINEPYGLGPPAMGREPTVRNVRTPGERQRGHGVADPRSPDARRRDVLKLSAAISGCLPLAACAAETARVGAPVRSSPAQAEVPVTPPEDLMREHGVLKRVLLIYREAIRRVDGGQPFPAPAVHAGAGIIRRFIEDYHERLEEQYVFPPLVKAGRLTDTVATLRLQHQRGRDLTARILRAGGTTTPDVRAGREGVAAMTAFIRMYEPHEAREDTVVFPEFRAVVPPKRFGELGEIFEDEEHRRFGANGFANIVDQVAEIEKNLGIYDLAQFTPRA
jgi:hemerythrin-like domain-containing protein